MDFKEGDLIKTPVSYDVYKFLKLAVDKRAICEDLVYGVNINFPISLCKMATDKEIAFTIARIMTRYS